MVQLEFHGAAHTVTGSCYLVKTDSAKFLVDCGMFQGEDVEAFNLEDFKFNPAELDFVVLTHAHIDHSGMLPKLVRHGFKGKIYATPNTIQISALLLLDSAKIQEGNFRRGINFGKYTKVVAYAYNTLDAERTIEKFEAKRFNDAFTPVENINVKLIRAGHVLGAASIEVNIYDGGKKTKVLFSGDIGRAIQPLIESFDLEYKAKPDYILMESLYGGQIHPTRSESVAQLGEIITETINRGGNVLIPSFAVQRTQEILHDIRMLKEEKKISNDIPVYLDSPLAQKVSNFYTSALQHRPESLFSFDKLIYVQNYKDSQKLDNQSGQIIIAGSGMADGGRIVEHLSRGLSRKKNSVVFVGFQAEGTLGRQLVEGSKKVVIAETSTNVVADIHYLKGFSAHGDDNDYKHWIKRFISPKLKNIFLIHAEPERAMAMADSLKELGVENTKIPTLHEGVELI